MAERPDKECHRCGELRPAGDFVPRGRNCAACRKLPPPSARKRAFRPCMWCLEVKAPEEFPWGPGRGKGCYRRRRSVCTACLAQEKRRKQDAARERAERQATWEHNGVTVRRCSRCDTIKPLEDGFYVERRNPDGSVLRRSYQCKACQIERVGRLQRERLQNPETAEEARRRKTEQRRKWRENNRERYRELQKQYRKRVLADPERHARAMETARMAHRLKREQRDGIHIDNIRSLTPTLTAAEGGGTLPAGPLSKVVEAFVKTNNIPYDRALEEIGAHARQLSAWRTGEIVSVQFAVATRVLTKIGRGWWEVWTDDDAESYERARQVFEGDDLTKAA